MLGWIKQSHYSIYKEKNELNCIKIVEKLLEMLNNPILLERLILKINENNLCS